MPRTSPPLPSPRRRAGGRYRALARAGAGSLVLLLGAGLSGCAQRASASGPPIELAIATVGQPQGSAPTDAYLVIRNNGRTDRLVSARSSAGGTVTFSGPLDGNPAAMRAVPAIRVPGHTLYSLAPNGYHLVISDSGPMRSGKEITLTLTFARSGSFQVPAEVTNPQTGGSSYFLN